jgi:hypothetical protein
LYGKQREEINEQLKDTFNEFAILHVYIKALQPLVPRFNPTSAGAGVTVPSVTTFSCGWPIQAVLQMCDLSTQKVKEIDF